VERCCACQLREGCHGDGFLPRCCIWLWMLRFWFSLHACTEYAGIGSVRSKRSAGLVCDARLPALSSGGRVETSTAGILAMDLGWAGSRRCFNSCGFSRSLPPACRSRDAAPPSDNAGLAEELVYRGVAYVMLLRGFGEEHLRSSEFAAALIISCCFGLGHIEPPPGPLPPEVFWMMARFWAFQFGSEFLFGALFALMRWRSGSLLGSVLAHGASNVAGTLGAGRF
jgi:hypothetical protein